MPYLLGKNFAPEYNLYLRFGIIGELNKQWSVEHTKLVYDIQLAQLMRDVPKFNALVEQLNSAPRPAPEPEIFRYGPLLEDLVDLPHWMTGSRENVDAWCAQGGMQGATDEQLCEIALMVPRYIVTGQTPEEEKHRALSSKLMREASVLNKSLLTRFSGAQIMAAMASGGTVSLPDETEEERDAMNRIIEIKQTLSASHSQLLKETIVQPNIDINKLIDEPLLLPQQD